jgi:hypothetical protein
MVQLLDIFDLISSSFLPNRGLVVFAMAVVVVELSVSMSIERIV